MPNALQDIGFFYKNNTYKIKASKAEKVKNIFFNKKAFLSEEQPLSLLF